MKRGRKNKTELKEKIDKLVQNGFSFKEIAKMLEIKNWQTIQYHYHNYRKLLTK